MLESVNEGINDKMKKIMTKLAKSLSIKSVVDMYTGKGSLSYFLDDEKEALKLQKFLQKSFKRVRKINLDKSKGDTANFVVAADMLGLESVNEADLKSQMKAEMDKVKKHRETMRKHSGKDKDKADRALARMKAAQAKVDDTQDKIIGIKKESVNERSAISLNLWIKEFERLAKKNRMKPVDFIKKHISKRKGMDNQVVKDVLKHFQKKESVNEAVEPTGNIKKVLDVAKNKQAKKIGGTLVDGTTANMMTQVWNKVNDSSKEKMNKMNTKQLINLILRMWKAMGTPRV